MEATGNRGRLGVFKRFFLSERNIMIAILLNAVIIFWMYFPDFKDSRWLTVLDHFFIVFFLTEVLVKMNIWKPRPYFSSRWNRFDFIIIIGSLPSLFIEYLPLPDTSMIIILRLFRVIRLVRFFQFVPHVNQIMVGLGRALKASVFLLAALVFLNFLLAVFTCHFYSDIAPEYFGDPLTSAYSIFQMFTIEGWHEIPSAIIAHNPDNTLLIGVTRFYFVLVVLFGGIFGMSLANAVFVDEMTMDNNQALENKIDDLQTQIAELKELVKTKKPG